MQLSCCSCGGVCAGNEDLVDVIKDGNLVAMLLDMCELALHQVTAASPAQDSTPDLAGCDQLWAALTALVAVLALHEEAPPMPQDLCCDLMLLFTDIAQVGQMSAAYQRQIDVCLPALIIWCFVFSRTVLMTKFARGHCYLSQLLLML